MAYLCQLSAPSFLHKLYVALNAIEEDRTSKRIFMDCRDITSTFVLESSS